MPAHSAAGSAALLFVAAIYLAATSCFWSQLFLWPVESESLKRCPGFYGRASLWLGATVHLVAIGVYGPSLFYSQSGLAALFAWVLVVSYLMIGDRLGQGVPSVVTPVALVCTLCGVNVGRGTTFHAVSGLFWGWLAFHIVTILAAYVALAFGFVASTLYLAQETLLKRRQLRGLWLKLPSLQVADAWIYRATSFGLSLLTVGIVTGLMLFARASPGYVAWRDPTVLFSLATWCSFAAYIGTRKFLGWHGRRSNLVVIGGFFIMVISFLGAPHLLSPSR